MELYEFNIQTSGAYIDSISFRDALKSNTVIVNSLSNFRLSLLLSIYTYVTSSPRFLSSINHLTYRQPTSTIHPIYILPEPNAPQLYYHTSLVVHRGSLKSPEHTNPFSSLAIPRRLSAVLQLHTHTHTHTRARARACATPSA